MKEIGIGCNENGEPKPFQIQVDGRPFAGADTAEEANKMFDMYSDKRPAQGYNWTLLREGSKIREVRSGSGKGGLIPGK